MLWDIPFYLIGYTSKYFRVIGLSKGTKDEELDIHLKCKNCGNVKVYHLKDGKVRILRCKQCNHEEVMVPNFQLRGDRLSLGFFILKRQLYRKSRASLISSGTPVSGVITGLKRMYASGEF